MLWWIPVSVLVICFGSIVLLRLAQRAMWRGSYRLALLWLFPLGPLATKLRAQAYALAGRSAEAEKIIRKRLAEARTTSQRARELSSLSDVLLDQELYAEAKACLDEAISLDIGNGSPCNEMASWYLRQGIEPRKALEFVEQAIAAQQSVSPQQSRLLLPFRLANKAWALAQLGRHDEAEDAINEAFRVGAMKLAASWAFVHWTAGMAYAAMGEKAEARGHFEQARKVDPRGNYGKRAAAALESN